MIVGKKKFNYGEVTTEPIYEGLAVAANVTVLGAVRVKNAPIFD